MEIIRVLNGINSTISPPIMVNLIHKIMDLFFFNVTGGLKFRFIVPFYGVASDGFKFKTGRVLNMSSLLDGLKYNYKLSNMTYQLLQECNWTHYTRSLTPTTLHTTPTIPKHLKYYLVFKS